MKGKAAVCEGPRAKKPDFRGMARALIGAARNSRKSGTARVGLAVNSHPQRGDRIDLWPWAMRLKSDSDEELLEELRKSLRRVKALEGLKENGARIPNQASTRRTVMEAPRRIRRMRQPAAIRGRTAVAALALCILIAIAAGWALFHIGGMPGKPVDVSPPRWKDESATHFTFAASADFGGLGDTDSTALALRARAAGMSFLLALGDLGNTTNEAGWCSQMKHYVPEVLIVPGSHDVSQGGGEGISDYVENCPYPLTSPAVPGVGTPGYGYEYYFDYPAETPLARFIMISPGLGGGLSYNYSEESPHTEWLEDAVDNARDQGIPWVVAGAHAQCITIGVRERCTMGQGLFDELVEAKVDLILAGGDHAYERSKQLRQSDSCESVNSTGPADPSCVADGGSQDIYPKGNGTVVVVQGVGGEDLTNITVDGSNPQIGYFAQAMGRNANTKGELPGFGSVFYTVTADSVTAKTDFCPTGSVGPDGHCTADRFRVFADRFSISDSDSGPASPPPDAPTQLSNPSGGPMASSSVEATAAPRKVR